MGVSPLGLNSQLGFSIEEKSHQRRFHVLTCLCCPLQAVMTVREECVTRGVDWHSWCDFFSLLEKHKPLILPW